MNLDASPPDLLDCGLYISYMNYYATGEGVTSCVALGGSHGYAEEVLKKRIDAYFHRAVETTPLDQEMNEEARLMLARIPDDVKNALRRMPRSAGYYFAEFYYNLA